LINNFLSFFSVYIDKTLNHKLNSNDVINLVNSNNELDLYITLDDLVSSESIYSQVLVLQGEHRVILFDIVREIEGVFFRDFDLVENIEVQAHFDTKPILKTIFKRLEGLYFYQQLYFLKNFSFEKMQFAEIKVVNGKLKKENLIPVPIKTFFKLPEYLFSSVTYDRPILKGDEFGSSISGSVTSKQIPIPEGNFYEIVFSDKFSFVKDILTDDLFNYYLKNEVLYADGLFGMWQYAVLQNMRPTIYESLDLNAQDLFRKNSSYYLSQIKHNIAQRWNMWLNGVALDCNKTPIKNQNFFSYNVYTEKKYDFVTATRIVGLGVCDVYDMYKKLEPALLSTGMIDGDTVYLIYRNSIDKGFNAAAIISAATLNDGKVVCNGGEHIVYDKGQGTEYNFFVPINDFLKKFNLDLDFVFETASIGIGEKSFWLVKRAISNESVNTKYFTEFYDREHACPFDNVEFYCPIPLALLNYDASEMYLYEGLEGSFRNIQYVVQKRRYEEDKYGNVIIKDLPEEYYGPGTWKIPINKNEYVSAVYVPNAITSFVSKNVIFHIKIKFKKTLNRNQNIYFRLFTSDLTFASIFRIKKG